VKIEHLTKMKAGVEYELTQISGFEEAKKDDHPLIPSASEDFLL